MENKTKMESRLAQAKRHMKVAANSSASALGVKVGHVHATARAERQKDTLSPEGLASEA